MFDFHCTFCSHMDLVVGAAELYIVWNSKELSIPVVRI